MYMDDTTAQDKHDKYTNGISIGKATIKQFNKVKTLGIQGFRVWYGWQTCNFSYFCRNSYFLG